jgi:hypothetical protein
MEVQKLFFEAVIYNNGSQRSSTRDMPELLLQGIIYLLSWPTLAALRLLTIDLLFWNT